eukprot:3094062-Karenia_brevis.AAC.1
MFSLTGAGRRLDTFRKVIANGGRLPPPDLRFQPALKAHPMRDDVLNFLRWVHSSIAECLLHAQPGVDFQKEAREKWDMDIPLDDDTMHDPMTMSYQHDLTLDICKNCCPTEQDQNLELRHLDPGSWIEIYSLYVADRACKF